MAITNKHLRLMAERESATLLQQHLATGLQKSILALSNGFTVEFENLNCDPANGCFPGFETIIVNGQKRLVRVCKRADGSLC